MAWSRSTPTACSTPSPSRWRPFARVFTDGSSEQRYSREFVFGQRRSTRYFEITTDPVHLPRDTTWEVMTNLPGMIECAVGNTYCLRTWIEYGFKQAKDELGMGGLSAH